MGRKVFFGKSVKADEFIEIVEKARTESIFKGKYTQKLESLYHGQITFRGKRTKEAQKLKAELHCLYKPWR